MKKKIALVLAAVAVVSMLAGCSNKFSQVLVGEWATYNGATYADMVFDSDGTYTTGSTDGTWSISNDGVLTGQYDWGGNKQVSIVNIEIVDNDTIRMYNDTYSTYLYRIGASHEESNVSQNYNTLSSRVISANSKAASIKNNIDRFLTDCDTKGYPMKRDDTCVSEITISVTDGTWEITNSNTNAFKNGSLSWCGSGSGRAAEPKSSASSAEDVLAMELADLFPTNQNASIKAYLEGGRCSGVVYVEGTSEMPAGVPGFEDFKRRSFEWSGDIDGTTSDDIAVGTAPSLG